VSGIERARAAQVDATTLQAALALAQIYVDVNAPAKALELLNDEQLGPVMQELTMRPGDALYLRAGVPHRCITSAPCSLHMSCDLVDNTPTVTEIATEATNQYAHACELPYAEPANVVDRYVGILKSDQFQAALTEATQFKRQEIANFRQMIGRSSSLRSLNKFS